jgi:hypothetical protein
MCPIGTGGRRRYALRVQEEVTKALNAVGISTASLDKIRLARGVVGKASYVAGATIFAIAVIAFSLRDPFYLFCLAPLAVFVFVAYFVGALWFAHKHPGVALLEGAELIQWRQLDMAARDVSDLEKLKNAAPQLIGSKEGE